MGAVPSDRGRRRASRCARPGRPSTTAPWPQRRPGRAGGGHGPAGGGARGPGRGHRPAGDGRDGHADPALPAAQRGGRRARSCATTRTWPARWPPRRSARRSASPGAPWSGASRSGVAAVIATWNYPLILAFCQLAPALAAGCTIVLKPAAETSLSAYILAEAFEAADFPPGVFNLVTGTRQVAEMLAAHPGVDIVAFAGPTPAGRRIAAICGETLKPVSLELGGKSAAIVLDDADLAAAAADARPPVLRQLRADVLHHVPGAGPAQPVRRGGRGAGGAGGRVRGRRPDGGGDHHGPAGQPAAAGAGGVLRDGRGHGEGARVVAGGRRPATPVRGYYYEPTVLADADAGMAIARDEICGPVVTVIPYEAEAEAVAIANDSRFGLAGTVWTDDPERGLDIARRARVGTFGVNLYVPDIGSPWGGRKAERHGQRVRPRGPGAPTWPPSACSCRWVTRPQGRRDGSSGADRLSTVPTTAGDDAELRLQRAQPDRQVRLGVVTGEVDVGDHVDLPRADELQPQVGHPGHLRQVQQRPQGRRPHPRVDFLPDQEPPVPVDQQRPPPPPAARRPGSTRPRPASPSRSADGRPARRPRSPARPGRRRPRRTPPAAWDRRWPARARSGPGAPSRLGPGLPDRLQERGALQHERHRQHHVPDDEVRRPAPGGSAPGCRA